MNLILKKHIIIVAVTLFVLTGQVVLFLDYLPILSGLFSLLRIVLFCFLFVEAYRHRLRFSSFEKLWLMYFGYSLFITLLLTPSNVIPVISICLNSFLLVLLFRLYGIGDMRNFLLIFSRILSLYIYINLFFMWKYQGAMWTGLETGDRFLLAGNYNGFGPVFLLALTIEVLYMLYVKKYDWNFLLLIAVIFYSLYFVGSMTSLVGLSLLLVFIVISRYPFRRIVLLSFAGFYVIFQILAVFLLTDFSNNQYIRYFVEEVLGKDLSFTERTDVWGEVAKYIAARPIFGYGFRDVEWYNECFSVLTAHNFIYKILLDGGLILLLLLCATIWISVHSSNIFRKERIVCFLHFAICTLFFMMIMEADSVFYVFVLFMFLFYSKSLLQDERISL